MRRGGRLLGGLVCCGLALAAARAVAQDDRGRAHFYRHDPYAYRGYPVYSYYPYTSSYYDWPAWRRPTYVLPPVVLPAETLFGPQAARRFLEGSEPSARESGGPRQAIVERAAGPAKKSKVRVSNKEFKARAAKLMALGDGYFRKHQYRQALDRYKMAGEAAPDVGETWLRQGFALVALAQFEPAAKAFRRALGVRPDWSDCDFRLDQIYGDDRDSKIADLELLAQTADDNAGDAEWMLLLGLFLYFDDQAERSQVFFERCEQLGGNEDHALDFFLPDREEGDHDAAKF